MFVKVKMKSENSLSIRKSNLELLRIIAMFLVLVVHADYFSLGAPTAHEIESQPVSSFTRIFMESISIVCVNVFVLLSGWFGIHPKFKSISNFCFQCLFFLISIYVVCLLFGLALFNLRGVAGCFSLTQWDWFVKAYIVLYIISPVLNAFIESTNKKKYQIVLLFFFLFQSVYGWLTQAVGFYVYGYAPLSFIGLYLLARYIYLYSPKFSQMSRSFYIYGYLGITLFMAIFCFVDSMDGESSRLMNGMFTYYNPLVILSSLCLLLYFSKLSFQRKLINWVAASSFAVYLMHMNPNIAVPYFQPLMRKIYEYYDGIFYLIVVALCLLLIFMLSVLIDQIRIITFKYLYPYIEKYVGSLFHKIIS